MGQPVLALLYASRDPKAQLLIAKRVLSLAERDFDLRYVNPADPAITVYLWVLEMANRPIAEAVGQAALGLKNGWWAPRFARRLLCEREQSTAETLSLAHYGSSFHMALGSDAGGDYEFAAHGMARHLLDANVLAHGAVGLSSSSESQATTINSVAPVVVRKSTATTTDADNFPEAA